MINCRAQVDEIASKHSISNLRPMRTTLEIDDDVYTAVRELSAHSKISIGAAVSGLLRQALFGATLGIPDSAAVTGFRPFPARGAVVSNQMLDQLRESDGA